LTFKRKVIQGKSWISLREFRNYTLITVWVLNLACYKKDFILLEDRILKLWKSSGPNFAFLYLKECMRLVIRSLAGQPDHCRKIMVKVDSKGLPMIIPSLFRHNLLNLKNQRVVIGILTIISLYRVFPTRVKVSINSLIDPCTGIIETFSVPSQVYKELGLRKHSLVPKSSPSLIGGESSGPNSYKASWGGVIDALAFLTNPWPIISYCFHSRSYWPLVWLVFIWVFLGPLYILICLLTGTRAEIGRLSVIYDQAGKARVVAITNYWLQLLLKPLHDRIFRFLSEIDSDGTFNQVKPLNKLKFIHKLNSMRGIKQKYHCFDLSAATDRLPVKLQSDILTDLGFPGDAWRKLLDIPWLFRGKYIKYSVGQPMGAYSSWAMLALTHHVIVKTCSVRLGLTNFKDYGILGDDVVIYNDDVAKEYHNLMNSLGLEINPYKTIQSDDFAEFAKKWVGETVDISPLGPGLVLQAIRDKTMVSSLILDVLSRQIISYVDMFYLIKSPPKFIGRHLNCVIGGLLISSFRYWKPEYTNDRSLDLPRAYLDGIFKAPGGVTSWEVREFFKERTIKLLLKHASTLRQDISHLLWNCFRQSQVRNKSFIVFDTIFILLNPGFWHYFLSIIYARVKVDDYLDILTNLEKWLKFTYPRDFKLIISDLLDMTGEVKVSTIKWDNKIESKKRRQLAKEFMTATSLRGRALEQFRLLRRP